MNVDVIIVGQGLSGSILAMELLQRGKKILVIDAEQSNSASKVAIGLVNPITGKRLVKSWMIDTILPFAHAKYNQFEQQFDQQFLFNTQIARVIPNRDIFEQWQPNFQSAVNEGYISPEVQTITFENIAHRFFYINKSFWINTKPLLKEIQQELIQKNAYRKVHFQLDQLEFQHELKFGEISASKIVFCRGAKEATFDLFSYLPFNLSKGEVIDVHFSDYDFNAILKKNIFIVPDENMYRIGSTYNSDFKDDQPSTQARAYIETKVKEVTGKSFTLLRHKAAIRPSTIDRRPFIGKHPNYSSVFIFNGFGSKGVSLLPYFSSHFCDYLFNEKKLLKEVNIQRFS